MAESLPNDKTLLNNHTLPEDKAMPPGALRAAALKIALSYEGKQEVPRGSNWGPFVKDCLATVGLAGPASWCMAFVYRCFLEAAQQLGVRPQVFKTAGVLSGWNNSDKSRHILKADARPDNILPGYQFVLDHGQGLGHTGIVVEMRADGSYITIEGNTDPGGSRNGYGVFTRLRRLSDKTLKGFIKYDI